jgi:integrase
MSTHAASTPYGGDRPTIENRKVPLRRANVAYRSREYLSDKEVAALMAAAAAGVGRHRARDTALTLMAYRHGLRVSELVSLRWDQVDLQQGLLHITRRAQGATLRRCGAQDRRSSWTRGRHRVPGPSAHAVATPPATSRPTMGRTRGRSSISWGTATFSIPPATPNWRRTGSRISGAISLR